jgi:homoserine kinase type II
MLRLIVAAFTPIDEVELTAFLRQNNIGKQDEIHAVEAGSVNSNFSVRCGGSSYFLRLYEEQDASGAAEEMSTLRVLAASGVSTPTAVASGTLSKKPAALFPWIEGTHACQRAVSAERARAVGASLARVHLANAPARDGRFDERALRARLASIDAAVYPVDRLARTLDALARDRDRGLPSGLTHGDLFRDNVLWDGDRVAALLDFESASRGAFVYDLAVTMLAWCYGDAFDFELARAMVAGYESARALRAAEKHAFYTEARMAAVRFTITRITDYAMRGGENRVMKDWRRFLARLDALEALGERGLAEALLR